MKSFGCLLRSVTVLVFLLSASSLLQAAPWAVVADNTQPRISMLDFGTTPATVYGPFLEGQLGLTGGQLLDVAITPDGQYALMSKYTDKAIYRVDISNPTNPVVSGCVSNRMQSEDIVITPNGRYALVTDAGSSAKMGIIDLSSFSTSITYSITSGYAQAVAVTPDNQTVVLADYANSKIIYGVLCPTGLVAESTLSTGTNSSPCNLAIARH